MASRNLRKLADAEINQITRIVAEWRAERAEGEPDKAEPDRVIASASLRLPAIRQRDFNLSPSANISRKAARDGGAAELLKIGELRDRLERQEEAAREKDAIAMEMLRKLTP